MASTRARIIFTLPMKPPLFRRLNNAAHDEKRDATLLATQAIEEYLKRRKKKGTVVSISSAKKS